MFCNGSCPHGIDLCGSFFSKDCIKYLPQLLFFIKAAVIARPVNSNSDQCGNEGMEHHFRIPALDLSGLLSLFDQPDLHGMLLFPAVAGSGALIGRKNVIPFCISDMINAFKSGGVRLIVLSIEYSSKRQSWSLAKRLLMRSLSIFRSK